MGNSTTYFEPKKEVKGLEDAKKAVKELHGLTSDVFTEATKEGYQQELAMYILSLKQRGDV